MDLLPLIYKKIRNIRIAEQKDFEKMFFEICNLIEQNLQRGYIWGSFYSYYNLFYHLLDSKYIHDIEKYFFTILYKLDEIVKQLLANKEEIFEILLNNPFYNQEFLEKLENNKDYIKIKLKLDNIFSNLPKFSLDDIDNFYRTVSLHNFLKFLKILIDNRQAIDEDKISEMIVTKIFSEDIKVTSESISDIIGFGMRNREFHKIFIKNLLIKIINYLYWHSECYQEWKKIFLISTYENIARYFRIVNDFYASSFIYLLAAIENWNYKNYGYCSKCIYQISRILNEKYQREVLLNLAINLASLEVSFSNETQQWKKERANNLSIEQIKQNLYSILVKIINNFEDDTKKLFLFKNIFYKIENFCKSVIERLSQEKVKQRDKWIKLN